MQPKTSDGVRPGREPVLLASMYFRYGNRKRPEVTVASTFEAILVGQRTSTTRFLVWPGAEQWRRLQPGDMVRVFAGRGCTGEAADLVIDAEPVMIDLAGCDEATLEDWSKAEGWLPEVGRQFGRQHGPAVWIRYRPAFELRPAPPSAVPTVQAQGSLF